MSDNTSHTSAPGFDAPVSCRLGDRGRFALWSSVAGVAALAMFVFLFNLGGFSTFGMHEGFSAVPAREMQSGGDWVVPTFGGLLRLNKPPLNYWMIAGCGKLFGEFSEWTSRLPSALASLFLVALVGGWAYRWYGRAAGLAAAVVQSTSVYMIDFGRQSLVDMPLCLLITTALFLVAEWPCDEPRRRASIRWTAIYGLLALSWLAKFHYGTAMVLMPTVVFLAAEHRTTDLWRLLNPVGLAILAAAVVVWPYLVLQRVPDAWEIWQRETIGRSIGVLEDRSPVWFYLPQFAIHALPWTPLAIAAIPASWKRAWQRESSRERFLWYWLLVQLAIVTVSASKHRNYILPTMPVFSLMIGSSCCCWITLLKERRPPRAVVGVRPSGCLNMLKLELQRLSTRPILATVGVLGGCIVADRILVARFPYLSTPIHFTLTVMAAGLLAMFWLVAAHRIRTAAAVAAAAFVCCYISVAGSILPGRDHHQAATRFARLIRRDLAPLQNIVVYNLRHAFYGMDPVVFYIGEPVECVNTVDDLRERLSETPELYVLTYQTQLHDLSRVGQATGIRTMDPVPHGEGPLPKHPPLMLTKLTRQHAAPATAPATGADDRLAGQTETSNEHRQ